MKNKIGIFIYDWGMYHYIKDLAIKLAEGGFFVDVFFKDWDLRPDFTDTTDFKRDTKIRFYNFTSKATSLVVFTRRLIRVLNRILMSLNIAFNFKPTQIISPKILKKSIEIIGSDKYYCYIGIEKEGLIWAGILSDLHHCPLVYYSLELFFEDNPILDRVYHFLEAERKYHKKSVATIIQDSLRAKALMNANGVENSKILTLPVSTTGDIVTNKSQFLQNRLNIKNDKKILLYFGGLDKTRSIIQIVEIAKNLDENTILVLHGFGPKRYIKQLLSKADKDKVKFSFDFVPESEIVDLISSAHIGIALYKTTNSNDRLVAFSASKIAYYTQCGIPIIAFDTESFQQLADSHKCVELITNFNEIPLIARKILNDYDRYRQSAFEAYMQFYNVENNYSRLINELKLSIDAYQSIKA